MRVVAGGSPVAEFLRRTNSWGFQGTDAEHFRVGHRPETPSALTISAAYFAHTLYERFSNRKGAKESRR